MNIFGHNFRLAIWGESHGHQIGISLDGVPAGIPLSEEDFAELEEAGADGLAETPEEVVRMILNGMHP